MEGDAPEWLNLEFLEKCLNSRDDTEKIKILKFTLHPAAPEGSGYGSYICRVRLEFKKGNEQKTHSLHLIVKAPLKDGITIVRMLDTLKDVEADFYSKFLPLANQLGCESFSPKCFLSPIPSVIVMEDLKEQGFVMGDRFNQLDYDHCCLYTIASAKFHASSIAVHKLDPELVKSLGEEKIFSYRLRNIDFHKKMLKQGIESISDYMEKTQAFKKYTRVVRESESYILDKIIEAHMPKKEGLNSLTQGDPWISNMMFKYDEFGTVSDVKLFDFQGLRYASPINDLVFFLWTSASCDVRENHLEDIYNTYCETFNKALKELNCPETLTYVNLIEDVKSLMPLLMYLLGFFIPAQFQTCQVDISDIQSIENGENGKPINKLAKYYTPEYCENILTKYLEQFEKIGVFEYLESLSS